jgi:predicted DNA-binding transcriptional regulator AlpA
MAAKAECLTMTIPEFAEATGCSKNLAYTLARQDQLPVPVIKLGQRRMCVSRRAVEQLLEGNGKPGATFEAEA